MAEKKNPIRGDVLVERNKSERVYCHDLGFSADPRGPLKKKGRRSVRRINAVQSIDVPIFSLKKPTRPAMNPLHYYAARFISSLSFFSSRQNTRAEAQSSFFFTNNATAQWVAHN